MPKSKEEREYRNNLRRQARFLFERFIERAEQREISQVIGMLHHWVAEEATMLPEDREEIDLIEDAMIKSREWPGVSELEPEEAQDARLAVATAA